MDEKFEKALEIGKAVKADVSPTAVADFILTAQNSMWMLQCRRWAEKPPMSKEKMSMDIFQEGAKMIIEIVDRGYDETSKTWWKVDKQTDSHKLLSMCDMILMVHAMGFKFSKEYRNFVLYGFQLFADILMGYGWEARFRAAVRGAIDANKAAKAKLN
jgi:hypothetical protein